MASTVLTLCGSLRASSSNHLLLRAASRLAPEGMRLLGYRDLAELPHFNPDLDSDPPPTAVGVLRALVGSADGLLISSPEYAHGVPGSLKNALDWLVSSAEFPGKPVLLMNVSTGDAAHLQEQLVEILTTMSARVVAGAPLLGATVRKSVGEDGAVSDPLVAAVIVDALGRLAALIGG